MAMLTFDDGVERGRKEDEEKERERERRMKSIFRDGVGMGQPWLSQLGVHTHYFNVGSNACY